MERALTAQDADTTGDFRDEDGLGDRKKEKEMGSGKMALTRKLVSRMEKGGTDAGREDTDLDDHGNQPSLWGAYQDHYVSAHSRQRSVAKMLIPCVLFGTEEADMLFCSSRTRN